jgi:phosphate transport system substrate-binding protein
LFSCADRDKKGNVLDTPTAGEITIAADESLRPLVEASVKAFEGIYGNAHINIIYASESEAVHLLLKDSVRLTFLTRELSEAEHGVLEVSKIIPHEVVVAYDAVAVIGPPSLSDSSLSVEQLKGVLSGKISLWSDLFPGYSNDSIDIVFDHPRSAITRYLQDSLGIEKLSSHCYAVNDNPTVISTVSEKKNTIGLIGVSWISDHEDSAANQFTRAVKVMSIQKDSGVYQPYQAYIAQRAYPLIRPIYVISREARAGLGSGFLAFVAGDKGQRIVLKAGLLPATMPIRIVEVNHEPL